MDVVYIDYIIQVLNGPKCKWEKGKDNWQTDCGYLAVLPFIVCPFCGRCVWYIA